MTGTTVSARWTVAGTLLPPGPYTVTVEARDAAGNLALPQPTLSILVL